MQSLDSLRRIISPSPYLAIDELASGYPIVQVAHPAATATIALHGAHLMSWQPTDARPVIYTSPEAIYREGKAIRGGIPLCWPWFGAHPTNPSKPSHGFARDRFWDLAQVTEDEDALRLVFHLPPLAPVERSLFPHHYALEFTLHIGRALKAALRTTNLDDEEMVVGGALHSYFAVGDLSEVAIEGLEGVDYLDCVGERVVRSQIGPIHFGGEVDRIYHAAPPVRLIDRSWNRNLSLGSEGSRSTVVWNPFFEKAAALRDLPDAAFRDFVCIETANAGPDLVTLLPGESSTLLARISL